MKRNGILNSDVSRVLSYMGHTDQIAIGDCGLPIPDSTERIDLALAFGEPPFIRVLELVLQNMKAERSSSPRRSPTKTPICSQTSRHFFERQKVDVEFVPHTAFKAKTADCKAVIRTGETTPYANIILQSGCIFAD